MKFPSRFAVLISALIAGVAPLAAQAQEPPAVSKSVATAPGKGMVTETIKATAVVSEIDAARRTVWLKTAEGKLFDVVCGPEVKNFAQLKVGDKVHVQYTRALSLELKKVGAPTGPASGTATATTTAPEGAKPAVAVGAQMTEIADVTAVNAKTHTVTLRGSKGDTVDLEIKDPEQLKLVKVGDKVEATYTEAMAIVVKAAK